MKSTKKLLISILLGLGGFWLSLYSLKYNNPPFVIAITWSIFLPLMAAMAYGPVYGFAAGVLGLGAFYPFLIYPNNGWANIVNAIATILWFVWYGYCEQLRQKKPSFWNHPLFVHLPYAVFYAVFIFIFYPIFFSFNPPFWNLNAERAMPTPILGGGIAKGIITMYLVVIANFCILKVNLVRKIFDLEVREESRQNGWIVSNAVLGSILLWYVLIVFDRIFIDQIFPENLAQILWPHEVLALTVFLFAGFFIGSILCQYVESRLKIEEELKKSRESYRLIFEQAADGIFITDLKGNFVDANESGCKLTGYTRDEILQLNMRDVLMVEEQKNILSRVNKINAGEIVVVEPQMRHKNGSPISVEISARKLADGRLQGLVRDVSQSKQIEEALRANNELFTQFMRHSPIYAYVKEVTPTQSLVLQASENYQEMIGIPGSQMVGKNMYELFPAEFAAQMTADDWTVVTNGVVLTLNEELNGRSYTTIKFPIRYNDKTFLAGYSIDLTDQKVIEEQVRASQAELQRLLDETELSRRALLSLVEDQKEAEEQIRQLNTELEQRVNERTAQLAAANKELEAFAYSVSHDLRAPLRALNGFSAALLDDYAGQLDEEGQHYLYRIQEASQRMGQLIDSLLDLSKVTRVELKYQQVDLSELAYSIITEINAQAPERRVDFEIAPHIIAQGDASLLKIALENLLGNAYKFTSKCAQTLIQVGVVEHAGEQIYFVKDNGTGFNMDHASQLFIPFQRLHSDKEFPGTGIGLSIVHRIITRHGGHIWPESKIGQGTTFYFTLKDSQE